jgi:hypothetical protein
MNINDLDALKDAISERDAVLKRRLQVPLNEQLELEYQAGLCYS